MEHTNVFIVGKAINLLMRKVYLAFLICFSLFAQAQGFIYLSDSTVISIREVAYISGTISENAKTKIYIFEGTTAKNFDSQNLANADIIPIEKEKSLIQKKLISKSVEKPLKNIPKAKKREASSPHSVIGNADSETYFSISKSDLYSVIVPLSLQWGKAFLDPILKIKTEIVTQQIGCSFLNEKYHYLNYSKSFKVRPPPAFV